MPSTKATRYEDRRIRGTAAHLAGLPPKEERKGGRDQRAFFWMR